MPKSPSKLAIAVDTKRLLIVTITIVCFGMPWIGQRGSAIYGHPKTQIAAMLCPVRPRRRFPAVKPDRSDPRIHSDPVQVAVNALRRLSQVRRGIGADSCRRAGVTPAQLAALRALDGAGAMSVKQLARETMTSASSISEVTSRLVRQGLVARARSPRDGRGVELSLTADGRVAAANASSPEDELRNGLGKMTTGERTQLSRLLQKLITGLADGGAGAQLSDPSTSSPAV
jgi:DNA-binding MarR family transcriptional regulator